MNQEELQRMAYDTTHVLITVNEGAYNRQGGASKLRYKGDDVGCHEEFNNPSSWND